MPEMSRTGKICAVVAERSAAAMVRALRRALRVARMVELRLDWLRSEREILRMIAWVAEHRSELRTGRELGLGSRGRVTLIATCRRRVAGGEFRGSVAARGGNAAWGGAGWMCLGGFGD